ncbi:cupin domain-containing protein [Mycoplasmopsis gallinarum]|uniref:cupin domain-containing protein n=1 Tax=Mycoplasmopsis gallinarum TaxID=29557 RepID=UPI00056B669A|nr:cupin domain-containing protein [Mycoplasmopsis gallinarum]
MKNLEVHNLYKIVKKISKNQEINYLVTKKDDFELELIFSNHTKTTWLSDKRYEYVFLIKGKAEIETENKQKIKLKSGDFFLIQPNLKHQVVKTSKKAIWIAIYHN